MSIFYKPETSKYLTQSSDVLHKFKLTNQNQTELFACKPLENITYKDTRNHLEITKSINLEKLTSAISKYKAQHKKKVWIVISAGGFAPIHISHINMLKSAITYFDNVQKEPAIMGYVIPGNAQYTSLKLQKRGKQPPTYTSKKYIANSIKYTFKYEDRLDLCSIDLDRISYCEWYVSVSELINLIKEQWNHLDCWMPYHNIPELAFAFVGGEDLVRSKNQLYKGIQTVDFLDKIMTVPRNVDVDEERRKKYPLANDIIILPATNKQLSSSLVRTLIEKQNMNELEKLLHPRTLTYLLGLNEFN